MLQIINPKMSIATIVEPTGVPDKIAMINPLAVQNTEIKAEQRVTLLKLLKILMAERAGKITKAEISREPTRFMAKTIIIAVMIAIIML